MIEVHYKVSNWGPIRNMDFIELKPATIVSGHAGTGKSRLLDSLMMLKRSLNSSRLNLGRGRNSFKAHVSDNDTNRTMTFEFRMLRLPVPKRYKDRNGKPVKREFFRYKLEIGSDCKVRSMLIESRHSVLSMFVNNNGKQAISLTLNQSNETFTKGIASYGRLFPKFRGPAHLKPELDLVNHLTNALRDMLGKIVHISSSRTQPKREWRKPANGWADFNHVSADGGNIPEFLASFRDATDFDDFSDWIEKNTGIVLMLETSYPKRSRISLKVRHGYKGKWVPIADAGSGVWQMLPILAQIWKTANTAINKLGPTPSIVIVEKPENFLHPRLQAKISDALSLLVKNEAPVSFLMESNSEHIVNRFGDLIENHGVDKSTAGVVLLDHPEDSKQNVPKSQAVSCEFDVQGCLSSNWPYGFYEY